MEQPSFTASASPAPRYASTWSSLPGWCSKSHQTASNIYGRKMSEASDFPVSEYFSGTGNIVYRKASMWDDTTTIGGGNSTHISATHIAARRATILKSCTPASAGCIAGPRATTVLQPKCDEFAKVIPKGDAFTWGSVAVVLEWLDMIPGKNRKFYAGNINYIFDIRNGKDELTVADIEAIIYIYGVENTSAMNIVKNICLNKRKRVKMNSQNKKILLASTIKFSGIMKEPLCILRQASRCYQEDLLSPNHFVGYMIHVLKSMFVGMHSILRVLEGSTNRELTTKDVETFVRLWKVTKPEEVKGLVRRIDRSGGTVSRREFFNMLYQPNTFGKQPIKMFDTQGKQDPSMFFFLIDKDSDGFLSSSDFRSFASIFGRNPSDESIERVTRKLDMDGDSKISLEDFCGAMEPILDGITWEFWLVTILIVMDL